MFQSSSPVLSPRGLKVRGDKGVVTIAVVAVVSRLSPPSWHSRKLSLSPLIGGLLAVYNYLFLVTIPSVASNSSDFLTRLYAACRLIPRLAASSTIEIGAPSL